MSFAVTMAEKRYESPITELPNALSRNIDIASIEGKFD